VRRAWTLLIVLAASGCATIVNRTYRDPGPTTRAHARRVDWSSTSSEATSILSRYLQIDTTNPPGNELKGAAFLAQILEREGIATEIVELEPGRGSLIARLTGNGKARPLCLLSHIDVVPGDPKEWEPGKGPLSGAIDKGEIWGRGALDMKGMGIVELMTVLLLHRSHLPLARDVILIAVADEEVGNRGMRQLVGAEQWSKLDCAEMINEGGIGLKEAFFPRQTVYAVSVAEKGVLWLELTARGKPGHGSTPLPDSAPSRLVDAIERIRRGWNPRPELHPALYQLLASAGEAGGGLSGFVLRRPTLVRWFALGQLMAIPPVRAAITNTLYLTGFRSVDHSPNVVPGEATAIFDSRLLPGHSADEVLQELEAILAPQTDVSIRVLHTFAGNESPLDDPLYQAIMHHAAAGRADVAAGPTVSPGFTDSIFARTAGAHAYGFVPFEVTAAELATMHGPNERISIENLARGTRLMFEIVVDVAVDQAAPVSR
jgi:acetylornithine deacetylase/succinyl-diaminopimelate desuccinylase-like protein